MEKHDGYYTLKGYSMLERTEITSSMEDYMEMIFKMHAHGEVVRTGKLAQRLHVKPSSATKMVENLKNHGLVLSEKYGHITPTILGTELGEYLVFRHDTVNRLLCRINRSSDELEQAEKIEHFLNFETVKNISRFLRELGEDSISQQT